MTEIRALLGRVIAGKFEIEEHVGGGAMGEVFRARHVVLDTAIGLKIMRADIAKDAMFKERFYREAKAASRLDHPNSVRVLDFGVEPDGLVYLAMEFLHGRDLLSVLREEWPLPDTRVVDLLVQVLGAVSVAHELGIVHRDLKPENIMVSVGQEDEGARPYHVKVCDFGIAKLNDPRGFQTESGKALTSSGTLIGTPEYMSPEQARGDPLDARSDLYSVGVILYQLLVGKVPFSAENALGVVLKQVTDEPVPPSTLRAGVNARLEAICLRALKKPREDRYQSAKEMRRDLRGVFGSRPNSLPDESGALHLYAPESDPHLGAANAATLGESDEIGKTLLAPIAIASGRIVEREHSDLSPRTSDGTELTVAVTPARRYLGAIAAVAMVALLIGAGSMVVAMRHKAQAESAAASGSAPANAPPVAAAMPSGEGGGGDGTVPPLGTTAPPVSTAAGTGTAVVAAKHAKAGTVPSARASASAARAVASTSASTSTSTSTSTGAAAATGDPSYNAAGAFVALGALSSERVREDVMRGRMSAALPKLTECYRSALMMMGAPVAGSAEIHMSIDDKGNVTSIVNAPKHPAFARCAQGALGGQKVPLTALEGASSMGATATQWLTLHP